MEESSAERIRAKVSNLDELKVVVPRVLLGCKDHLATEIPDDLSHETIGNFHHEISGSMDNCGGYYQLHVRTEGPNLSGGKIFVSYRERESRLDLSVDSQIIGGREEVHSLMGKVKGILDDNHIPYENV